MLQEVQGIPCQNSKEVRLECANGAFGGIVVMDIQRDELIGNLPLVLHEFFEGGASLIV